MKESPESDPREGLPDRSSALVAGAATLLASGLFRQILGFLTLAITARLLSPEDFGIAAFFLIATTLLEMMQRQVSVVLIRLDDVSQVHLDTVFTFQVIIGALAAVFFFILQPVASFVGIPELVQLVPALCLLSITVAFRSPRFILFERKLQFRHAAGEETLIRVVYSVFVITLAWVWRDFWAIVVANIISLTARGAWTFRVAPMAPHFSLAGWRDSFSFLTWSMGAQIAQFLSKNMPQIVIGASLGLADAGIFRLGNRITMLVTTQVFAPFQRVIYPALADISRNTDQKDAAFVRINEFLVAILLPISIGMALVADHIIVVVFGFKWLEAWQVIAVLAPLRALEALQDNVRAATYVDGSTKLLFIRNTVLLVLVSLLMWIGVKIGFTGAVIAAGASSVVAILMTLAIAKRFGNRTFLGPLTVSWRSIVSCIVMIAVVTLVGSAYGTHDELGWAFASFDDVPKLRYIFAVKVLTGVFSYVGSHLLLWILAGRPDGFETTALQIPKRLYKHFNNSKSAKLPQTK
ncbi:oligosaccharide flippase family protein [Ruegeria sediminis]|uniref:oligosaccharide flippase family protein n=1 Tax=Ruegeria sediminis TaxID=2583820 RepID=UPI0014868CE5|nr:oligosaccharide flippase family protein [Ruegeria sediminis]